jgi:NAD(P)-dependent dehydrogenase (short-subunit alcohol dehydrogenase family)
MDVNLRGTFLCAREELRIMKAQPLDCDVYAGISAHRAQRGAIVNIASGLAFVAMPECAAYCASKAGIVALTRADALDYSHYRIRVNAVLPGIVETAMTTRSEEARATLQKEAVDSGSTPMKRWGMPEEIADACLWLCGNGASFVQGVTLPVDGGYLAV